MCIAAYWPVLNPLYVMAGVYSIIDMCVLFNDNQWLMIW